jgi:hypothetical protein
VQIPICAPIWIERMFQTRRSRSYLAKIGAIIATDFHSKWGEQPPTSTRAALRETKCPLPLVCISGGGEGLQCGCRRRLIDEEARQAAAAAAKRMRGCTCVLNAPPAMYSRAGSHSSTYLCPCTVQLSLSI